MISIETARSLCFIARTRRMRRMAAMPDVAMTLALLETRLRSIGMMASAAWSNRLPSTDDRCLMEGEEDRWIHFSCALITGRRRRSAWFYFPFLLSREVQIKWAMRLTPEWCRPPSPPEIAGPWQTAWTPPPWDAAAAGSRRTLVHRPGAANALSSAGGAQKKVQYTHTFTDISNWGEVRTCSYSCHSQLPVPLVVRQHVSNLRHGFLHLPVRVDLTEERERRRSTHEQESYSLQMETVSSLKYMSHMY